MCEYLIVCGCACMSNCLRTAYSLLAALLDSKSVTCCKDVNRETYRYFGNQTPIDSRHLANLMNSTSESAMQAGMLKRVQPL